MLGLDVDLPVVLRGECHGAELAAQTLDPDVDGLDVSDHLALLDPSLAAGQAGPAVARDLLEVVDRV